MEFVSLADREKIPFHRGTRSMNPRPDSLCEKIPVAGDAG